MRSGKAVLLTVIALLAVGIVGGLAYVYSGSYNVAATAPHGTLARWLLNTTQQNSVRQRAQRISAPQDITEDQRRHGAQDFAHMCVVCHGGPGVERGEYGKGLTPTPPNLSEAVREWSREELFWIVKHGIKLAGMPAFGPTHSDEELWGIVAFVERLPQVSPDEFRAIARDAGGHGAESQPAGGGHGHSAADAKQPQKPKQAEADATAKS